MEIFTKKGPLSSPQASSNPLRVRITYSRSIKIPKKYRLFFWDCPQGKVILEKFILRLLQYGKFEDLKWLYNKYPEQTYNIASKYPEIKRGVKFWIKWWKDNGI